MAKKKMEIKVLGLDGGVNCICQVVDLNDDWATVQNPVICHHDPETQRLNMTPLLRFGARDTDASIPMANVNVIYVPTEGLLDEYISVFVEQTKSMNEEEEEAIEEETVEV
jgi:hypothetical protein